MTAILQPRRPMPLALLGLCALMGCLGCFYAGEAELTPEDIAWATEDLSSVEVLDAKHALVTSLSGSIYRSTDAARVFRRVHTDPKIRLYDLSMADSEYGWAVGDDSILATRDGGLSWRAQPLPTDRGETRLRAVFAIDRDHALAVGLGGARLRTENGGRSWEDRTASLRAIEIEPTDSADSMANEGRSQSAPAVSGRADLYDVFCADSPTPTCVSLGAFGGTAYSIDLGASWIVSQLASPASFDPIRLHDGDAVIPADAIARLEAFVQSQIRGQPVSIRIEAVASANEITDIGHGRDPEALFEILEARALDVEIVLEEAGVPDERIRVRGAPAWAFEEMLDDDPDFLERYWRSRSDREAGVYVHVDDARVMRSGGVFQIPHAGGGPRTVVLAVGSHGGVWRSFDGGAHWVASDLNGDEGDGAREFRSLARDSVGIVGVDAGGTTRFLEASGAFGPAVAPAVSSAEMDRTPGSLNDISYSDDGQLGLLVGDAGRIFRMDEVTVGWQAVAVRTP